MPSRDSYPATAEVRPLRVQELVQSRKDIFSIQEDTTVHDAARYLRDHNIRSVGVLDASGMLVGVVSQSDISNKVAAENKCPAWMRISEIMTRDLLTVRPDVPLDECLRLMEKHGVFHLLVLDESGRFLGMISVADLLQVIASDQKARADMFEAFVFPQR
jgi:CBS domain-containing protein